MLTRVLLPLVAVGLLIYSLIYMAHSNPPEEVVPPPIQPSHNPYSAAVAGPGVVEAAAENIAIGSPISGVIVEVVAKVGMKLEPGTPLFRLDDRQLQADLAYRKAAVEAARADLTRLENQPRPEEVRMLQAVLEETHANLVDQQDQLARSEGLSEKKVHTKSELITHQQAYQMAKAKYDHAKAEFDMKKKGAWEFDKLVAKVAVDQAETQVRQVETEIQRLVICSQTEGEVLQVNVRPGEFVGAPSTQALVVVGDVDHLHVRVDVDEFDIPRFRPGAAARASLKGQTKEQFDLTFVRVEPFVIPKKSLTGENTERVDTRVLPVIYELHTDNRKFFVGQQLDVYIEAESTGTGNDSPPASPTVAPLARQAEQATTE